MNLNERETTEIGKRSAQEKFSFRISKTERNELPLSPLLSNTQDSLVKSIRTLPTFLTNAMLSSFLYAPPIIITLGSRQTLRNTLIGRFLVNVISLSLSKTRRLFVSRRYDKNPQ